MILRARQRSRPERLLRDRWGGSYLPMVSLLFVLILAGPSLTGRGVIPSAFVASVEMAATLFGVLGATASPKIVKKMIGATVIAVAVQFIGDVVDADVVMFIGMFGVVAILFYVQSLILRDVMPEPKVSVTTIIGAVGTYLLSIVYWATIYSMLSILESGAFQGPVGSGNTVMQFLYFSAITQTTVGYGDIVPVTSFARSLASMQAIIGQLYVAILVAWLVGRAVSERGS